MEIKYQAYSEEVEKNKQRIAKLEESIEYTKSEIDQLQSKVKSLDANISFEEKVKADTDGDKVDSMIYGVEAMRRLELDEDDLKLTEEEIKEVDAKIDRWYKKSPNSTVNGIKDMAEKFKAIQKNPKYHEDISPLLSGAAVSNKEVIDGITNAIREVTKPNKDTKKPAQKKRRKRTNSKKKSGEKK